VSCEEGARTAIAAGIDSIEHGLFLDDGIVQAMKDKGVFLVPTLWLYRRLVELGEKGEIPEWKAKRAASVVPRHLESFQRALRAGVKIATGTDSGEVYTPIGESLLHEMETLYGAGMSAMEVIISATSRAAELLRMTADLGTVQPGKVADLLILDGDPLTDIKAVYRTWMVFKEGRLVYRMDEKAGRPVH
jgi:imidazolonepropionase-like amidohydrolase